MTRSRVLLAVMAASVLAAPVTRAQSANSSVAVNIVTLDAFGGLHPTAGSTVDTTSAPYWPGWRIARGVALLPGGTGGYVLDGYGGLSAFGAAPPRHLDDGSYWQGWDIARSITTDPCDPTGLSGWVLDGYGGIHSFGGAPRVYMDPGLGVPPTFWWGQDIARSIAAFPSCSQANCPCGAVLDAYGGEHTFVAGGSSQESDRPWTWKIARAVEYAGDGTPYILDGYGGLHGTGITQPPGYFGWDIARGMTVIHGTNQGYVLDGWGGLHSFNGAPPASGAYWPGWDIAVAVASG